MESHTKKVPLQYSITCHWNSVVFVGQFQIQKGWNQTSLRHKNEINLTSFPTGARKISFPSKKKNSFQKIVIQQLTLDLLCWQLICKKIRKERVGNSGVSRPIDLFLVFEILRQQWNLMYCISRFNWYYRILQIFGNPLLTKNQYEKYFYNLHTISRSNVLER